MKQACISLALTVVLAVGASVHDLAGRNADDVQKASFRIQESPNNRMEQSA